MADQAAISARAFGGKSTPQFLPAAAARTPAPIGVEAEQCWPPRPRRRPRARTKNISLATRDDSPCGRGLRTCRPPLRKTRRPGRCQHGAHALAARARPRLHGFQRAGLGARDTGPRHARSSWRSRSRRAMPRPARLIVPLGSGCRPPASRLASDAGSDSRIAARTVRHGANRWRVLSLARATADLIARVAGRSCPALPSDSVQACRRYGGAYGRAARGDRAAGSVVLRGLAWMPHSARRSRPRCPTAPAEEPTLFATLTDASRG